MKFIDRLEEWLISFLIALATLITCAAVLHRYLSGITLLQPVLLNINMAWAQELTIYLFVWMAKIGAAYGVRTGIHVGVDVLINQLATPVRNRFVLFGLLSGALFTAIIASLGAYFVWENGLAYSFYQLIDHDSGVYYEGPVTPDLEWPTWIVYSAIPLASLLMCFRFLQVAWVFRKTGELPQHDHGHVDGVDEQIAIGEAFEAAEEIEHGAAGKTGGRK